MSHSTGHWSRHYCPHNHLCRHTALSAPRTSETWHTGTCTRDSSARPGSVGGSSFRRSGRGSLGHRHTGSRPPRSDPMCIGMCRSEREREENTIGLKSDD